jgi:tripartite-type tricarboxylate transporter receptor subunit TctC
VRDKFVAQNLFPAPMAPEEFAAFIGTQTLRYSKIIKAAGIKAN